MRARARVCVCVCVCVCMYNSDVLAVMKYSLPVVNSTCPVQGSLVWTQVAIVMEGVLLTTLPPGLSSRSVTDVAYN